MCEHIGSSINARALGTGRQPRPAVLTMLEAAFSAEGLARSSRSGEKGQSEGGGVPRGGRAAGHGDLRTAGRVQGKDPASSGGDKAPAARARTGGGGGVDTGRGSVDTGRGAAQGPDRRRLRTVYTVDQVRMLERSFRHQRYLGTSARRSLAGELCLSETQIKTWFQDRRMKLKQQLQVARAEGLKCRLFLQYFCYPYHSAHSLHRVADSSLFPHYPEFGPLPTQTSISDCSLRHLDYQPNLPPITPKATTSRHHPRLTI